MFNYRLTINKDTVKNLEAFEGIVRKQASRSCEVTTEKKRLEAIRDNTDNAVEERDKAVRDLAKLDEAWKKERKGYDLKLYGGKNKDGKKVGGLCDCISDKYYEAYTKYILECDNYAMYDATAEFLAKSCVKGTKVRDRAVAEFTTELMILIGGKVNGNSKLAKGESFITTMNKRAFKKVVFGAIIDIINKTTIKAEEREKALAEAEALIAEAKAEAEAA